LIVAASLDPVVKYALYEPQPQQQLTTTLPTSGEAAHVIRRVFLVLLIIKDGDFDIKTGDSKMTYALDSEVPPLVSRFPLLETLAAMISAARNLQWSQGLEETLRI